MKDYLKSFLIKLIIVAVVVGLDMLTKHFFYGADFIIIPYILGVRNLNGSLNTGGAWSILSDKLWLLIALTFIFIALVVFYDVVTKHKSKVYTIGLSFVLGGTIGNLIDRLILGGVRDFIFFPFMPSYPTFNLADSFLLIGIILCAVFALFIYKPKDKKVNDQNRT